MILHFPFLSLNLENPSTSKQHNKTTTKLQSSAPGMHGPCHRGRDSHSPQSVKSPRSSPAVSQGPSRSTTGFRHTKGWRCENPSNWWWYITVIYLYAPIHQCIYIYICVCNIVNICICFHESSWEGTTIELHGQRKHINSSEQPDWWVMLIRSYFCPFGACQAVILVNRFFKRLLPWPWEMGTMQCKILR